MKGFVTSVGRDGLSEYLSKQLNCFYPDSDIIGKADLQSALSMAMDRIETCFEKIELPYYSQDAMSYFNHLNGDHYSMFLYLISNELYKNQQINIATKVFLLNKALFGVDAFYSISLPTYFLFVHPIGTVLGKASYSDFFVVYQRVTIGANEVAIYPSFSERTVLYSNSSVIGDCHTGTDFILGANSSLINTNVPHNSVVVGNYPAHVILHNKKNLINNFFSFGNK